MKMGMSWKICLIERSKNIRKRCRCEILKEEEDAEWRVRVCFHTVTEIFLFTITSRTVM